LAESAEVVARRVARRVVRRLIALQGDWLPSGPDSGLANVWEEICVQVQFEQSALWGLYDDMVWDLAYAEVRALPPSVLRVLWLETNPGTDWSGDWLEEHPEWEGLEVPDWVRVPYVLSDVADYVAGIVYNLASDWSNRRIRNYLERS
jgi:hypothetical protein